MPATAASNSIKDPQRSFGYASGLFNRLPCIYRHLRRLATHGHAKCGLVPLLFFLLLIPFISCSHTGAPRLYQKGLASWYGKSFDGLPTASGEPFDMHAMTAAHKTLPLGTVVNVYCPQTNRWVTVRINDRGPFIRGRIIDLSYGAAKRLGIDRLGVAKVELYLAGKSARNPAPAAPVAEPPAPSREASPAEIPSTGSYYVQVGAFSNTRNAEALAEKLKKSFANVLLTPYRSLTRVRIGPIKTQEEAESIANRLTDMGFSPLIRREK